MDNLQSVKQRYGIIGRTEQLDRALSTAVRVANTDLTVLLMGESGVGKEIFSRIIHDHSARKHNKFIAINCGAIPAATINSELFVHEKGSFTGATGERKGYFETYDGGTIFLDEIGEMPQDTQAFLLRVLESGEFIRVGSSKILKTDVRIIAATNVELEEKIRKGKFREDLFYRLNTVPIRIPPLRERTEDIYMLFRKFVVDFSERYRTFPIELDAAARQALENYGWPGNIRELKNMAEQLSVLAEDRILHTEDLTRLAPHLLQRNLPMIPPSNVDGTYMQEREILYNLLFDMKGDLNDLKALVFELIKTNNLQVPDAVQLQRAQQNTAINYPPAKRESFQVQPSHLPEEQLIESPDYRQPYIIENPSDTSYESVEVFDDNVSMAEHEKALIKRALKKHNGKRREAAQDMGISERTLYRKIKEYNL
ncbi:MAG: sigma-54-dependent Fis family transcriptional regulator [Saprospiraceae bacterium]|nr:sigma-54-dependent Fis family transcriptional regulator [Saprospiraceae bacterium]